MPVSPTIVFAIVLTILMGAWAFFYPTPRKLVAAYRQRFARFRFPAQIASVIVHLIASHAALARQGWFENQNRTSLTSQRRFMLFLKYAGLAIVVGFLALMGWALVKDPPTGGFNPGGPSPGTLFAMAIVFGWPFLVAGLILFLVGRHLLRRIAEPQQRS